MGSKILTGNGNNYLQLMTYTDLLNIVGKNAVGPDVSVSNGDWAACNIVATGAVVSVGDAIFVFFDRPTAAKKNIRVNYTISWTTA